MDTSLTKNTYYQCSSFLLWKALIALARQNSDDVQHIRYQGFMCFNDFESVASGSGSTDGAWDTLERTGPGNRLPLAPADGDSAPRLGRDGAWGTVPTGPAATGAELDAAVASSWPKKVLTYGCRHVMYLCQPAAVMWMPSLRYSRFRPPGPTRGLLQSMKCKWGRVAANSCAPPCGPLSFLHNLQGLPPALSPALRFVLPESLPARDGSAFFHLVYLTDFRSRVPPSAVTVILGLCNKQGIG